MNEKNIQWIITDNNITVNFDSKTHIIPRTDSLADKLILALKENRKQDIPELVSASLRVEKFSKGNFKIKDDKVFINDFQVPEVIGNKIIKFSNEGLPYEPLVKFVENIQLNPSFRAVNELYSFLEVNNHPITDTGCFIAYKKVRSDFTDVHTGKFDNSVGLTVKMPRNQVNEDSNETCSHGLHVANYDYASNFYAGGVMLELEVNPANVVAVPVDYNKAKMRVCEYKVLGVVNKVHEENSLLRKTSCDVDHSSDGSDGLEPDLDESNYSEPDLDNDEYDDDDDIY